MTYQPGAIKRNIETLSVAVKTNISDPEGRCAWGVMTVDRGGHYASDDEVADWPDVILKRPSALAMTKPLPT